MQRKDFSYIIYVTLYSCSENSNLCFVESDSLLLHVNHRVIKHINLKQNRLTLSRLLGRFDPEKLKKLYVDRVSKINTSNYANDSTNLVSFREN